jgi:hypothetical protein
MHIKSFYIYTTALLCSPTNLTPWRDSNPGLFVPETDAMSTAPRRQGSSKQLSLTADGNTNMNLPCLTRAFRQILLRHSPSSS